MSTRLLRIEPLAGYAPLIGRLVCMMTYARQTTLAAVEGMTMAELDHLHDDASNSIGALLAHIAAVERTYRTLTFDDRTAAAEEWGPAVKLGDEGRRLLRGKPLEHYVNELVEGRRLTLEAFAARDDDWLGRSPSAAPAMNMHWAWFHVAEDEINHRGQIRWLRPAQKLAKALMEWTDDDRARYIEATFPAADRVAVRELLASYGGQSHEREVPRVRRVLLQSCGASLERLRLLVAMAKMDYRDILTRDAGPDAR